MNPQHNTLVEQTAPMPTVGKDSQILVDALTEYHEAIDAHGLIDRSAFLAKYAAIRSELTGYLTSFDLIRAVAPQLHETGGHSSGEPRATLGDFRLIREIGRGGMGVVYEAEQFSLGRLVALKVLPFAAMLDKQQLARFKNEARAAATLDHPNIVQVYSVGVDRGVHYYAMHLVEGESLAQVIARLRAERKEQGAGSKERRVQNAEGGMRSAELAETAAHIQLPTTSSIEHPASSIPHPASARATVPLAALSTLHAPKSSLPAPSPREHFRTVARLGIQAAEALDHAHQNGILHRDVKPANLLVDDAGKLWVTDFGLARLEADAGMTMTGDLIGTLRYMSPEQVLAKRVVVDHRSDVYSLGATLYELLTLEPAFPAEDRQELLKQIAFEEPRRPRQVEPRIPSDLETIILKALEKNPADRYATAQELAADLQRFVGNEPIHAKPPTALQRVVKWGRRHRPAVASAGVASVVIAAVIIAALSLSNAAIKRERNEKTAALAREVHAAKEAEAGAKLALFLNLYQDRRYEEAETLLSSIPPSLQPPTIQLIDMLRMFGFVHAAHQRWPQAARVHEAIFREVPRLNEVSRGFVLLQFGPTFARTGDQGLFSRYREALVDQKLPSRNPIAAEQTCRLALILPANETWLRRLEPMYEFLRRGQVNDNLMREAVREAQPGMPDELLPNRMTFYRAFGALTLAAIDYRRGAYSDAIKWCADYPRYESQYAAHIGAATAVHSIAAMAHHQLGQIAEARTLLAMADIANQSPEAGLAPGNLLEPDAFYDRVYGDSLFQEARALIVSDTAGPDPRCAAFDNFAGDLYAFNVVRDAEDSNVAMVKWYRRAADAGYAPAQLHLGHCYAVGRGVETNAEAATDLFRKGLEQFSWTCSVTRNSAHFLAEPLQSAEELYLKQATSPAALVTAGALHYRAGEIELAEQRLDEAIAKSASEQSVTSSVLYAKLMHAMAMRQLGRADEAGQLFAEVQPDVQQAINDSPPNWNLRATLVLLNREANELIERSTGPEVGVP